MPEEEIGEVTHFFDKIGVCVLKLSGELKVGDKIRFEGTEPFVQTVKSMQAHHKELTEAKAGDDVGLKTDRPVRDGMKVVKLTD